MSNCRYCKHYREYDDGKFAPLQICTLYANLKSATEAIKKITATIKILANTTETLADAIKYKMQEGKTLGEAAKELGVEFTYTPVSNNEAEELEKKGGTKNDN